LSTKNNISELLRVAIPGLRMDGSAEWRQHTSIGAGIARFTLAQPGSREQLLSLTHFAQNCPEFSTPLEIGNDSSATDAYFNSSIDLKFEPEITLFPLGMGCNLIGSDLFFEECIFVKLSADGEFGSMTRESETHIRCGAAVPLKKIIDFALTNDLGGASGLYGIPGTVGGVIKMNAGANGQSISDFLLEAEIMNLKTGNIRRVSNSELDFAYRHSNIADDELILSAVFHLKKVVREDEKILLEKEVERRKKSPQFRSSGSVFRNPDPGLSAGFLLDKCGAKEIHHGSFSVSNEHANWIINNGSCVLAAESDYLKTIIEMAKKVYQKTGVVLTPEVRFINMSSAEKIKECAAPLRILVLKGGVSSERDVSLQSGANVAKNLRIAGHDVREFDIKELAVTDEMKNWAQVVYPVLHGGFGEDGRIQKLLEDEGIKYVGCNSKACKVVMDKVESKRIMQEKGISTPRFAIVTDVNAVIPEGMALPLIVKPASEGSTFGVTLVETAEQWKKALEFALKYDSVVVVEDFIQGKEATVGIVLGEALPVIEIRYPGKIYDYDAKYTHALGETLYLCPPESISDEIQKKIQQEAEKFAEAVDAAQLLRVDVMIDEKGTVFVLEGNSMPGCTASSLLPKAALIAGISHPELYSRLALSAMSR